MAGHHNDPNHNGRMSAHNLPMHNGGDIHSGDATEGGEVSGVSAAGEPIGLLLILTKAS